MSKAKAAKVTKAKKAVPDGKLKANVTAKSPGSVQIKAIQEIVVTSFQNDSAARVAITENLKKRSIASNAFTQRAQGVFSTFNPSRLPSEARLRPNYLKPDDKLLDVQNTVMTAGIDSIQKSNLKRTMRFVDDDGLKEIEVTPANAGSSVRTINLDKLISYINFKSPGRNLEAKDSVMTICKAEIEAMRILEEVRGSKAPAHEDSSGGSIPNRTSSQDDGDTAGLDPDALQLTPARLVQENVDLQMDTATSPESQLRYSIPNHSDQMKDIHNKPTFELRSGPSDVTAYHDFNSLQIAFENIWAEIIDGQITSLGQQLYEEYVKLKDFSGIDDEDDPVISTMDDLKQFMAEVKSFTQQTVQNIAPVVHSATPVVNGTKASGGSSGHAAPGAGAGLVVGPLVGLDPITAGLVGFIGGSLGWW